MKDPISIGRMAQETGIAAHTLRIWERRYGRPKPERLESGHRRYSWSEVIRIRQAAELLAWGYRPGRLFSMDAEEWQRALEEVSAPPEAIRAVESWFEPLNAFDEPALTHLILASARSMGTVEFLDERLVPFLTEIGTRWTAGRVEIRHEHFVTAIVSRVLETLIGERSREDSNGKPIVMSTLQGEQHGLGVRMVSLLAAEQGFEVISLGTDLPAEEISRCAVERKAFAVGLSLSLASVGIDSDRRIRELRKLLPEDVHLVVGGQGVRRKRRGARRVKYFQDAAGFSLWLRKNARGLRSAI